MLPATTGWSCTYEGFPKSLKKSKKNAGIVSEFYLQKTSLFLFLGKWEGGWLKNLFFWKIIFFLFQPFWSFKLEHSNKNNFFLNEFFEVLTKVWNFAMLDGYFYLLMLIFGRHASDWRGGGGGYMSVTHSGCKKICWFFFYSKELEKWIISWKISFFESELQHRKH